MKITTWGKLKFAIGAGVMVLLAGNVFSSNLLADDLSQGEIIKKTQEKYASLTSYSDEGKIVASLNGITITTTFTIKLARPNLYKIEWEQSNSASPSPDAKARAVWSAGEGDFLDMGRGVEKQTNQEMALASATGISGGAAATIPGTFFKLNWGNQFGWVAHAKQQPDEKVGDVDCYVFTNESKGRAKTLWIGKQDFLIHQVRNVTSAEAMKATMAEAAKNNPEVNANVPKPEPQGITSTETHTNIVVNQTIPAADFAR